MAQDPWQPADVERVVREVLARLQREPCATGSAQSRPAAAVSAATPPSGPVFADRLLSLAHIEGKLADARSITVPRRAVITPAARDYLKSRNITIHFAGSEHSAQQVRLTVGLADSSYDVAPLLVEARRRAMVEGPVVGNLPSVVERLTAVVAGDQARALGFSERPLAAVALANRHRGVRAAHVQTVPQTTRALDELAANLLVVHPRQVSWFELKQMIQRFLAVPALRCPDHLRPALDA